MGAHMLPGHERWRALRRSIRFTMTVILAVPVAIAVVMWAFAGITISNLVGSHGPAAQHSAALNRIALANAVGLVAILIAAAGMVWFARRLSRDAANVETSARRFADQQLPQLVERLRRGDEVDLESELVPSARVKITELARAAAALASVQRTALTAAITETNLRSGISQVFVSLARRSQSLLQRQLRLLDDLERKAVDPGALADLFPLDHLTTRMRRHAEGLIILSGAVPGRAWSSPVPVIDVVRGAIAEVEDYKRITVVTVSEDTMAGSAVADMIHLLAELIENAALFSPSGTRVEVKAERVGNGFAFEIEDRGLGIKPEELDAINLRLSSPADFDLANADQLGLFVVGKLAARHAVRVFLRPSPYGGTTAIVLLPSDMITPEAETPAATQPEDGQATNASLEDLQLALTGRQARRASSAAGTNAGAGAPPGQPGALPGQPDTGGFPRLPGSIPGQSDANHDRVSTPADTGHGRPDLIPGQADAHHGRADGGSGTPDSSHEQPDPNLSPAETNPSLPAFFLSQPTFLSRPVSPGQPGASGQPGTVAGGPGTAADPPGTAAGRPGTAAGRPALPRRKGTGAARPGTGTSQSGTRTSQPSTPGSRPGAAADPPTLPRRKGIAADQSGTAIGQSGTTADRLDTTAGQSGTPVGRSGTTVAPFGTAADPLDTTVARPGTMADRPGTTGKRPDTAADPPPVLPRRAGGSPDAGTYRGLPRRVRQANLSPHLRNSPSPGTAAPSRELQARSPEQAQSLLASLQSGWERGRRAELPDSEATASGQDAGASVFEVPQEEP